jgi:hypothetical protein
MYFDDDNLSLKGQGRGTPPETLARWEYLRKVIAALQEKGSARVTIPWDDVPSDVRTSTNSWSLALPDDLREQYSTSLREKARLVNKAGEVIYEGQALVVTDKAKAKEKAKAKAKAKA